MIELYQQALKEHNNNPIGLAKSIEVTHTAEGFNASCGDEITFQLHIASNNQQITDISFDCDCCAICKASASALCEVCQGRDIQFLKQQTSLLAELLNQPEQHSANSQNFATQLNFLIPIRHHISRHNCALLPWQTALNACTQPLTPININ